MAQLVPIYKKTSVVGHALLDDQDYDRLIGYRWFQHSGRYAARRIRGTRNDFSHSFTVFMHHEVLGVVRSKEQQVDHINGDRLDNRRCNLRLCKHFENLRNQRKHKRHRNARTDTLWSPYKGVSWHGRRNADGPARRKPWLAYITAGGKQLRLGYFYTDTQAARARDAAARQLHGSFARLNFPDP